VPATYRLEPDKRVVVTRFSGDVSDEDLLQHSASLAADSAFESSFNQIVDTRGVSNVGVTAEGIRELAGVTPFSPESRRAIIADSDVVFGLSRIFELSTGADSDHFRVCRTPEDALDWLGVSVALE
jgi:hypothetical protein